MGGGGGGGGGVGRFKHSKQDIYHMKFILYMTVLFLNGYIQQYIFIQVTLYWQRLTVLAV